MLMEASHLTNDYVGPSSFPDDRFLSSEPGRPFRRATFWEMLFTLGGRPG